MIDASTPIFPNNIVNLLHQKLQTILDPDDYLFVVRRMLRSSDPKISIGIWGGQVIDDESSHETGRHAVMGGPRVGSMSHAPTLLQYLINLQVMVKDGDEESGLARHSIVANRVRRMLARDRDFGIALGALTVVDSQDGIVSTERATGRRRIQTQRFYNNEVQGSFTYVATFEFLVETETT